MNAALPPQLSDEDKDAIRRRKMFPPVDGFVTSIEGKVVKNSRDESGKLMAFRSNLVSIATEVEVEMVFLLSYHQERTYGEALNKQVISRSDDNFHSKMINFLTWLEDPMFDDRIDREAMKKDLVRCKAMQNAVAHFPMGGVKIDSLLIPVLFNGREHFIFDSSYRKRITEMSTRIFASFANVRHLLQLPLGLSHLHARATLLRTKNTEAN